MSVYLLSGFIAFCAGLVVMVLEIVGARFLARDFGGAFYVWISQIGVVMISLGIGYYIGGWFADRFPKISSLGYLLVGAGIITFLIPTYAAPVIEWIVGRHPIDKPIPALWQKLDPVLGSMFVFFVPCLILAMVSPFMIRVLSGDVAKIGKISGFIIAVSTFGGIFGVFISGFLLIDIMRISSIFKLMGAIVAGLGLLCMVKDFKKTKNDV
ncbi:MAG: fused MFS/spermidine synthase [Verrucomicrobiia bacterium]|jgi:MFS family permease